MTNRTSEIRPVRERLAAIIDNYRINKNTFAKMIGLSELLSYTEQIGRQRGVRFTLSSGSYS